MRILIDDSLDRSGSSYQFENPCDEIRAERADEVPAALDRLAYASQQGLWAAGYFSYELGLVLESRLEERVPPNRTEPFLHFGLYEKPLALGHHATDRLLESWIRGDYSIDEPIPSMDSEAYSTRFSQIQSYVAAGDIYQLNLTFKGRFNFTGCPVAFYRDLRRRQAVSYGAFLQLRGRSILSLSPELFLRVLDGTAETRPMKGTAPRGRTLEEDRDLCEWLASDDKSRAENLMITDMMRNDLGRVAEAGTVAVSDLFQVETYKTLHQMTSRVQARLRQGTTISDVVRALFPPGSITGTPKVRAMEIIDELEPEPRGVYTGAIGYVEPGGNARFNVAIRTVVVTAEGRGEIGIGSGIVADSECASEYAECLLKMRFVTDAHQDFSLIETLRFDSDDGYYLLDRHMERLGTSAAYFNYAFDRGNAERALAAAAEECKGGSLRVRLLLAADGSLSVTGTPMCLPDREDTFRFVVSDIATDSNDIWLYHKTTVRDFYDEEYARAQAKYGADEVVFLNERGELTEGSRTTVFIERNGTLYTPPISCGLLAGTLRAELLACGKAREAVLTVEDLDRADAIYLGNSVRGLLAATPISASAKETAGA